MKWLMGLRVTEEEEMMGLDISEHGTYGYPEQMNILNQPVSAVPGTGTKTVTDGPRIVKSDTAL
ncbi:hypothetical protein D3C76_1283330 [compost metagenome]